MSKEKGNSEQDRIEKLEQRVETLEKELEEVREEANRYTPPQRIGGSYRER